MNILRTIKLWRIFWATAKYRNHWRDMVSGKITECFVIHNGRPLPCNVRKWDDKRVRLRVMGADKDARVDGSSWSSPLSVRTTFPMREYPELLGLSLGVKRRFLESIIEFENRLNNTIKANSRG